ncbi:hypothetical protein Q1695_001191 [Nippostrongylus brasiliensis]|nr:hypothetical protein Q1695_001191 [Nippostrongylus brasiliensis]
MNFLLFLLVLLAALCCALPPRFDSSGTSKWGWIRAARSAEPKPVPSTSPRKGRIVTVLGYKIEIPAFMMAAAASVRNFFVGPSGVITRFQTFLKGDTKVTANFFGRKVDFQANVPLSTKEVGKSISSFWQKLKTDPMARVLFAMYLNVVVIIVVYLALLAKHVQISLQQMRKARERSGFTNLKAPLVRRASRKSPSVSLEENAPVRRRSPRSAVTSGADTQTQATNEDNKTIDWDPVTNPSLINFVDQETITNTKKPSRLLNELEGLLSESSTQSSSPVSTIDRATKRSPTAESIEQPRSESQLNSTSLKDTKYYSGSPASELDDSTFDESQSQCLPTLSDRTPQP